MHPPLFPSCSCYNQELSGSWAPLSAVGCHLTTQKLQQGRAGPPGSPGSPPPPAPSQPRGGTRKSPGARPWGSLAPARTSLTTKTLRPQWALPCPLQPSAMPQGQGVAPGTRPAPTCSSAHSPHQPPLSQPPTPQPHPRGCRPAPAAPPPATPVPSASRPPSRASPVF